jgi:hypothetical protein
LNQVAEIGRAAVATRARQHLQAAAPAFETESTSPRIATSSSPRARRSQLLDG